MSIIGLTAKQNTVQHSIYSSWRRAGAQYLVEKLMSENRTPLGLGIRLLT